MSGTKQVNNDKSKFTEEHIDELYELGILNTEQMWQLREAFDLWEMAQKMHIKKAGLAGFGKPISYKEVPKEERPLNRQGPQTQKIDPNTLIDKMSFHLAGIKGHILTGRLYRKLKTCEEHLYQILTSIKDAKL